uniref:Uncharacterized protein n=1 Tax=Trypanosoma congolense (strain IL3000) TaxID=1068625 RepID=G0UL45_TRYCI|nr:conserved hypothetical protein [Trypanosoma congolense IL3000]
MEKSGLAGSVGGSFVVRSCFDKWDAVVLNDVGDGALLLSDGQRYVQVVLCASAGVAQRCLVLLPWESSRFVVRVNGAVHGSGPVYLTVGDEVELLSVSPYGDDGERRVFRVEPVTIARCSGGNTIAIGMPSGGISSMSGRHPLTNCHAPCGVDWVQFLKYRLEKVDKILSQLKV